MLCSGSVQEAHDLACVAHAATLETRVPFMHFFDGFRTSHEERKIALLADDDLRAMIPRRAGRGAPRSRADARPARCCAAAANPDSFFQAREACERLLRRLSVDRAEGVMDRFAQLSGRSYRLFDYVGHPQAERVLVLMGSGAEVAHETVEWMVGEGREGRRS